jgi:CHAT domain-containing protein
VILIPDGRLAQVPWGALPGRKKGTYLLEDLAITEAPYGQHVAQTLTSPDPVGDSALLVGGIEYGAGEKWRALPGADTEVKRLEKLRPGERTVLLSGKGATKTRVQELARGRRYIHLATHGEFLDAGAGPGRDATRFLAADTASAGAMLDVTARNPLLLARLVFAGANRPAEAARPGQPAGNDGYLTAEEVMGMDLARAEMVVLSACDTGAGKVRTGEGVFSLQRAFHVAGSRSVVATLWSIPDLQTQALMERFYTNLWTRGLGKLEALREAQLWLLREGSTNALVPRGLKREYAPQANSDGRLRPYYWAAFVLSGDWR